MTSTLVEIADSVYADLRTGAPDGPWVRLLALQLRERGSSGFLTSTMRQKVLWTGAACVSEPNIKLDTEPRRRLQNYFREDFQLPDWTRVIVECDVDGANRAMAWTDVAGPQEADFVGGHNDPFWNYVDDHRDDLEQLARRVYGS